MGDDTRCIMTFNKHLWVFFVAFFSPLFFFDLSILKSSLDIFKKRSSCECRNEHI